MPCRGCGGPIPGIGDYGARAVSTIGSILKDDTAVESLMGKFPTLSKLVYRYSLPASRLKSNVK
jgi:F420-non-reducing hydrogenase small subunit